MASESKWHEVDDFWELFAPFMFDEQRWEAAPGEIDQVLALLGIRSGTTVLDMGCGPGRHSLELARRGYNVTGVDRTERFLTKAKKLASSEGLTAEFILGDMRRFCRESSYDVVISLFTSFGYFKEQSDNIQVLKNVYDSLKPGGKLILDVIGKEVLARVFQARDWIEKDGVFYLQQRRVSKNWSWMENRWILVRQNQQVEYEVSHWIYSATELSELLSKCGFKTIEVYGNLDGAPYDHKAERLVLVSQKKDR